MTFHPVQKTIQIKYPFTVNPLTLFKRKILPLLVESRYCCKLQSWSNNIHVMALGRVIENNTHR